MTPTRPTGVAAHLGELSRFTITLAECRTAPGICRVGPPHRADHGEDGVVVMQEKNGALVPVAANPVKLQLDDFGLQAL